MKFYSLFIISLILAALTTGCIPHHYPHNYGYYPKAKSYRPYRPVRQPYRYWNRNRYRYDQCDVY